MVKIIWTKWAIKDLKSIFDFISLDSKFYAIRFTESLIERYNKLYIHPHSGRIVPEKNNPLIRELINGNYRIIYKLNKSHVTILRIHNSSRRIK
jgi:addiction module RelE/StbE family toxin